ncbi:MAG: hypothetical protein IKZ06_00410 [Oscillospiraceae bacterium]|nr:hypothetical protein [Oscillospiraceae bacterium]
MKYEKKIYLDIFWIILGAVLLALGVAEVVDSFWSGMGGALIAVGAVHTVRQIKLRKNEEYREKFEIESKDERNKFISLNAWAWAGYIFVLANALGTIGFKLLENEQLSQYCAFAVCLVLVLYWISYMILRKKY